MKQSEIRPTRIRKRLSLQVVAAHLGRTRQWLSLIETKALKARPETIVEISEAIKRLSRARAGF